MMPSAQQIENEEPLGFTADTPQADLHRLLHAAHNSNTSNLNSLQARGTVLFSEGEPARGVYILRSGRANISTSSSEGRVVMLRMAQAGDVLGLNSVLRGCPYDTTVKTIVACRTDFIPRAGVIELMQSRVGAQALLKTLSRELSELTARAKLLLLPQTVNGRLAKLLLEWSNENGSDTSGPIRLQRDFTHEEMAQMICSSRETVSRMLASLTKQQVIRVTADSIVICDRAALENIAQAT